MLIICIQNQTFQQFYWQFIDDFAHFKSFQFIIRIHLWPKLDVIRTSALVSFVYVLISNFLFWLLNLCHLRLTIYWLQIIYRSIYSTITVPCLAFCLWFGSGKYCMIFIWWNSLVCVCWMECMLFDAHLMSVRHISILSFEFFSTSTIKHRIEMYEMNTSIQNVRQIAETTG